MSTEDVTAGTIKPVGTDEEVIYSSFTRLLEGPVAYEAMSGTEPFEGGRRTKAETKGSRV